MLGLINNVFVDFLNSRFSDERLNSLLSGVDLPFDVAFESSCPYADGLLDKWVKVSLRVSMTGIAEIKQGMSGWAIR